MKYFIALLTLLLCIPTAYAAIERYDDTPSDNEIFVREGFLRVETEQLFTLGTKVPAGAARVPFLDVTFAAEDHDVLIYSIQIRRTGLGDRLDFDGVYLYEDMDRASVGRKFNAEEIATFRFNPPLLIEASESASFTVKANISEDAQPGSEHAMELSGMHTDALEIIEGLPPLQSPQPAKATTVQTKVTVPRPGANIIKLRAHQGHWNRLCEGKDEKPPICDHIQRIIYNLTN